MNSPTEDQKLWRVSLGMQQRLVRAVDIWEAAHKCRLGSGDLVCAEFEELDENGKTLYTAEWIHEPR